LECGSRREYRAAAHYTGMPVALAKTWVFASGGSTAFFLTLLSISL